MTIDSHYETTQREASFTKPADVTFTKRPATASFEPSQRNLESPLAVGESREWPKTRGIRALGVVTPGETARKSKADLWVPKRVSPDVAMPEPTLSSRKFGRSLAQVGSAAQKLAAKSEPLSPALGNNGRSSAISGLAQALTNTCDRFAGFRHRQKLREVAAGLLQTQCLKNCGKARAASDVQLFRSADTGFAHLRGLQSCGSVWACPVCSEKISRLREEELTEAIERWEGSTIGVTLTFSHGRHDDLGELLAMLRQTLKTLHASRGYRELKSDYGFAKSQGGGQVRALEVTHPKPGTPNANGWHPHLHYAIFSVRTDLTESDIADLEERLYLLWLTHCQKAGLAAPTRERGVVASLDSSATYVSKWGLGPELTRSEYKTDSQKTRCNPWQLLAMAAEKGPHSHEAGQLFREYAEAFKGQRQLYYSPGLKDFLGMNDKTDTEAAESNPEGYHVMTMGELHWYVVVDNNAQADVLAACEQGGAEAVRNLLETLTARSANSYLGPRIRANADSADAMALQ